MSRPPGFLQVDVDGLWAVRACYGKPENDTFEHDPCWEEGVPRLEEIFRQAGAPASFLLVGRDLELVPKRLQALKLVRHGYELGNHSYTHVMGLTRQPPGFVFDELKRTDDALRSLGVAPVGFRSPGYDVDARVHRAVRRLGYLYDASVLPSYFAPLLRVADAFLARRWDRNKRQFGRFVYGRAPRRPYFPRRHAIRKQVANYAESGLLEIPVGTTPFLHLPLTASTLFPLPGRKVRDMFQRLAERGRPVLLLLHAIDGTDCRKPIVFDSRRPRLAGFSMSARGKDRRLRRIVEEFSRAFDVVRADNYARQICRETE